MLTNKEIKRKSYLIDAKGEVLGRLATRIAMILIGKHKPDYTPHIDCGDSVIVINASKIKVTGKKADEKEYIIFSGYPGGRHVIPYEDMMKNHPSDIIRLAVKRMIPATPLGRDIMKKLKVYAGDTHPHKAQNPEPIKV
jgi:large subunit ribosomal protein L13